MQIAPGTGRPTESDLAQALKNNIYNISGSASGPWNRIRVFRSEGIHYILGRGKAEGGDYSRGLFTWRSGQFDQVCSVELRPQYP
jgi:hypothetical protein